MIAFARHPTLTYEHELDDDDPEEALRDMVTSRDSWAADWSAHSHRSPSPAPCRRDTSVYIIANSYLKTLEFELRICAGSAWWTRSATRPTTW